MRDLPRMVREGCRRPHWQPDGPNDARLLFKHLCGWRATARQSDEGVKIPPLPPRRGCHTADDLSAAAMGQYPTSRLHRGWPDAVRP